MNGYNIFLMIELAKCHGLISSEQEYDTTWSEGEQLYEEFQQSEFDVDTMSEYDCIEKFLNKKEEEIDAVTPEEELHLNIQALEASEKGDMTLSNTIWTLIELKGYERLDYTMSLYEMKAKRFKLSFN